MKNITRAAFAAIAVAGLVGIAASPAVAEGNGSPVNNYNRLNLGGPYNDDTSPAGCGSIVFGDVGTNGDDSPLDTNDRAITATVCNGDFAEAYTNASLNINRPVGQVKNISFDFQTASIPGAGLVQIVLITTTGHYLYLDPQYCQRPIGSGFISRADFTGTTALGACTFYEDGATPYTSDGTQSALKVYQAANPTANISYSFMGFFAVGADHTFVVDRVALGTNRSYGYRTTSAFGCKFNESRC